MGERRSQPRPTPPTSWAGGDETPVKLLELRPPGVQVATPRAWITSSGLTPASPRSSVHSSHPSHLPSLMEELAVSHGKASP